MASTGLHGIHELSDKGINSNVDTTGIGCYALGTANNQGGLNVLRIGRSDIDLNKRLHQYVKFSNKYPYFKYGFLNSVKDCYEYECKLWHKFTPSNNPNHPDKPNGTNYRCPIQECPH